jgi:CBS-domain-containing membrane protein
MSPNYTPIPHTLMDPGAAYQRPRQNLPEHVSLDSPALDVMTDLSQVAAITVAPSVAVEEAERRMIASGIRLLLVTDSQEQVAGIVTAKDLSGERLLSLLGQRGQARRDLTVHDIMTPRQQVEVLAMGDVIRARVGDLVATLKRMGRQHALVVDYDRNGRQTVRGILSTTQMGRQLGRAIEVSGMAHSMAGLAQTVAASQDKAH